MSPVRLRGMIDWRMAAVLSMGLLATTGCLKMIAAGPSGDGGGSLRAEKLRCEYHVDPMGIESAKPRLSWVLTSTNPGAREQKQKAYRVLVSSSESNLAQDKGDL